MSHKMLRPRYFPLSIFLINMLRKLAEEAGRESEFQAVLTLLLK